MSVRERDRRTYTLIWVVVTVVAATILVVAGSAWSALALVVVLGVGLVAFLRVTHPRGDHKPNLTIFFDDIDPLDGGAEPQPDLEPEVAGHGFPVTAAAVPTRPTPAAAPTPAGPGAEVIDLRQPARREAAGVSVDEAVAASDQAATVTVPVSGGENGTGGAPSAAPAPEVAEELSQHHVRLLRQVQVKLRDYE
jgi:hypothetical protein